MFVLNVFMWRQCLSAMLLAAEFVCRQTVST